MLGRDALIAKVAIDLIDAVQTADRQPLQVEFRRNAQVEIEVERVVVGSKWARHGAASDGLHHRRFHFDVAASVEVSADGLNNAAALDENFAHLRIDEQIEIALAVAQLNIGQPVPFLRQRQQALAQ